MLQPYCTQILGDLGYVFYPLFLLLSTDEHGWDGCLSHLIFSSRRDSSTDGLRPVFFAYERIPITIHPLLHADLI